jgi:YHS domain-containing protein
MNRSAPLFVLCLALAAACGGQSATPAGPTGPTEPAASARVLVDVDERGVLLGGHDPVAYATAGAPTTGSDDHASSHGGATYHFASAENKATFDAAPAQHAPRFGGYCAFAASQNRLASSDPEAFKIQDGELLMFHSAEFRDMFERDPAAHKAAAERNWPGLVERHGKPAP